MLALAAVAWSTAALAQPQCNERDNVLELLAKKYKETPIAAGVTNTGGLVEVIATPDGRTWTIIVTWPGDWACMVASGTGWRNLKLADEGSET